MQFNTHPGQFSNAVKMQVELSFVGLLRNMSTLFVCTVMYGFIARVIEQANFLLLLYW